MGTAASFDLSVSSAHEVFFFVWPAVTPYLIQFRSAISAEQHPGEHRHGTEAVHPSASVPYAFYGIEDALLDNGLVGVLEHSPFRRIIVDLFLDFEGLFVGLEIHRVAQILLFIEDIRYGPWGPSIDVIRHLSGRFHSDGLQVRSRNGYLPLMQLLCDLRRAVYELFGLSDEEIALIEATIRPMDGGDE